jgi:hypothetical protein
MQKSKFFLENYEPVKLFDVSDRVQAAITQQNGDIPGVNITFLDSVYIVFHRGKTAKP